MKINLMLSVHIMPILLCSVMTRKLIQFFWRNHPKWLIKSSIYSIYLSLGQEKNFFLMLDSRNLNCYCQMFCPMFCQTGNICKTWVISIIISPPTDPWLPVFLPKFHSWDRKWSHLLLGCKNGDVGHGADWTASFQTSMEKYSWRIQLMKHSFEFSSVLFPLPLILLLLWLSGSISFSGERQTWQENE